VLINRDVYIPGSSLTLLLLLLLLFVHCATLAERGVSLLFIPVLGFRLRVWMLSFFIVDGLLMPCSLK